MRLTREQAAVKLDIDGEDDWPHIGEITRLVMRAGYRLVAVGNAPSPSGRGYHIIIHVTPRPRCVFEVVALELLLGGDKNREAMQLFRARGFTQMPRFARDAWNILYEPHPHRMRHINLRRLDDGA